MVEHISGQISGFEIVTFIGVLVAIASQFFSMININRKNKEKFATKDYVKQENARMDIQIKSLEKGISDNEKSNLREHDRLERYFESIDHKLDRLIERENKK